MMTDSEITFIGIAAFVIPLWLLLAFLIWEIKELRVSLSAYTAESHKYIELFGDFWGIQESINSLKMSVNSLGIISDTYSEFMRFGNQKWGDADPECSEKNRLMRIEDSLGEALKLLKESKDDGSER